MDQLQPNPDGCAAFEPNPFKREKCRNCGHGWALHLGGISAATVASFTEARARAAKSKAEAEAEQRAKNICQARQRRLRQRAVEDSWYLDEASGAPVITESASSDSDENDAFKMLSVHEVQRAASARTASSGGPGRGLKIVNLIDFGECDVRTASPPSTPERPCSRADLSPVTMSIPSAPSAPASATGEDVGGGAGFVLPVQSGEVALLEELALLRHMLADANEEKTIQVSVARDEVSEKQAIISELERRHTESEALLQAACGEVEQLRTAVWSNSLGAPCSGEMHKVALLERGGASQRRVSELEALLAQSERRAQECERQAAVAVETATQEAQALRNAHDESMSALRAEHEETERRSKQVVEEAKAGRREAERSLEELRASSLAKQSLQETELWLSQEQLKRLTAPPSALASIGNEAELVAWEQELRNEMQQALSRLADRRVELRVAALEAPAAGQCKICFERPSSCAFLPCRHHAFCTDCGHLVVQAQKPTCPLCRVPVSGLFETYAS